MHVFSHVHAVSARLINLCIVCGTGTKLGPGRAQRGYYVRWRLMRQWAAAGDAGPDLSTIATEAASSEMASASEMAPSPPKVLQLKDETSVLERRVLFTPAGLGLCKQANA